MKLKNVNKSKNDRQGFDPNIQKASQMTVSQLSADIIWEFASKYWSPETEGSHGPYDAQLVDDIYLREIVKHKNSTRRIVMLEFSQYFEKYWWPNYQHETATHAHLMSIVFMVNEELSGFFRHVLELCLNEDNKPQIREKTALIVFLNHCCMEIELCRNQIRPKSIFDRLFLFRFLKSIKRTSKSILICKLIPYNTKEQNTGVIELRFLQLVDMTTVYNFPFRKQTFACH